MLPGGSAIEVAGGFCKGAKAIGGDIALAEDRRRKIGSETLSHLGHDGVDRGRLVLQGDFNVEIGERFLQDSMDFGVGDFESSGAIAADALIATFADEGVEEHGG